jgi:hypothetical protein
MALLSPGVEITVIDESFYDSSVAGTIPLIVVATASNKFTPSGTALASMTTAQKAGKLYLATSQRDLMQAYGNPIFYSSGGTPVHGYELNEYGLHAAYSFLGISNQAYVLRADIDTTDLLPSSTPPVSLPVNGTFWFDLSATSFGVFQSNGNSVPGHAWVSKSVTPVSAGDTTLATVDSVSMMVPVSGFGSNGDFGIVVSNTNNFLFEKIAGIWYKVGSTGWKAARPTIVRGSINPSPVTAGHTFSINGTLITLTGGSVASVVSDINTALASASVTNIVASLSSGALVITHTAGSNLVITVGTGTPLTTLGITAQTYKGVSTYHTNDASYPTNSVMGDVWVKGSASNNGASYVVRTFNAVTAGWDQVAAPFYPFDSTVIDGTSGKDAAAIAAGIISAGSLYVGYDQSNGVTQLRRHNGVNFDALSYEASVNAPNGGTANGALWYSTNFMVDIMVSDGLNYRGYRNVYPNTNPRGVFVQSVAPTVQSDGTALVDNDLWINTSELDKYPRIRRYSASAMKWLLVDNTDQTSPFGVIFADARQDSGTAFTGQVSTGYSYNSEDAEDLLMSDYVDPDAPDGRTVPAGMLLFNTRYSTYNVKQWVSNHFNVGGWDDDTNYAVTTYTVGDGRFTFAALPTLGRWLTVSGNSADGSPHMGRRAQRAMIVRAMADALNNSEEARSEVIDFNLIAAPGYPELIDEMVTLNTDQKNTAFVVGDTPSRLQPLGQAISDWANNSANSPSMGEDGLTIANPYVGLYYPWGLSTNVDGTDIMVPPSTMALRVMAYNDQVSYPWFAPAGFQRGLITNASSVGYLTEEGEYQTAVLSEGLRNVCFAAKINPIAYIPNRGLVVFGQKTLSPVSSALDRVNVARLTNYLAVALDSLAKPFLFQQNDQQTRDSFRSAIERFLSGLVGLRAIEDFAVTCDLTNNTRERINRSELWADVAILPTKSVEFIFIPLRYTNDAI